MGSVDRCVERDVVIPRTCKPLAEVDFPIAVVSKHAGGRSRSGMGIRRRLHLWWARRPLASSRAVLLALLLPDPCDPHCPEKFKRQSREILSSVRQPPVNDAELRKGLLWFIGALSPTGTWRHIRPTCKWGATWCGRPTGRRRRWSWIRSPAAVRFPLEALRLGCEAFASDLNPVACLILKVMLEDIPRYGSGLADELRRVGGEIKAGAERELAHLYPRDPDGATPIAYL